MKRDTKAIQSLWALFFVLVAGVMVSGVPGQAVMAQEPTMVMLSNLPKGEWELRFRNGEAPRKICLRTGQELIQLYHAAPKCEKIVLNDKEREITVHYTCPGRGYGQTHIRQETPRLLQLTTQGIEGTQPFEKSAEARRIGVCR